MGWVSEERIAQRVYMSEGTRKRGKLRRRECKKAQDLNMEEGVRHSRDRVN